MNAHNEVTLVDVGDPVKAIAQTCAEKCPMCNSVSEWRRHVSMAEAMIATLERFEPALTAPSRVYVEVEPDVFRDIT